MVIQIQDRIVEHRSSMRGGEGTIHLSHLTGSDPVKNCRLLSMIEIPPHCSIGEHSHNGETEFYIILQGKGIVKDNGTDKTVIAGDTVITGNGATHTIRNDGDDTLQMIAVIITE